ncbi:hypothetical protein MNV49_007886 [Pseudohyphozyma bogoriensis]|nr:hypothetical protein MNV49_007886 [Pseudohyphozyma bogoriensis]
MSPSLPPEGGPSTPPVIAETLAHPYTAALSSAPEGVQAEGGVTIEEEARRSTEIKSGDSARTVNDEEGAVLRKEDSEEGGKDRDLEKGGQLDAEADAEADHLPTHHANGLADQTNLLPMKQIIIVFVALTLSIFLSFLDQTIIVSLRDRGKYQGINEITIALANGSGPVIGGTLAEKVTWRWCFYINLPMGGAALFVLVMFLPLRPVEGDFIRKLKQIDYVGGILTILGAGLIIFPLNWGGVSFPWVSGPVLGCLFAGVIVLALLMVWEGKVAKIPIVPPKIFRYRTVAAVFWTTLLQGATTLGQVYYLPQYFQVAKGVSAIRSGVLILPLLLLITFTVFMSGQVVSRTGSYRWFICTGYVLWLIGLINLALVKPDTPTSHILGFEALCALGQGQTLQTSMVAAQAAVHRSEMSTVTAVRNFLRTLGGSFSLAIGAAIINNALRSNLLPLPQFSTSIVSELIDAPTSIWRTTAKDSTLFLLPEADKTLIIAAFTKGYATVFAVFAGFIGSNAIVALLFIQAHSLRRDDDQARKAAGKEWAAQQKKGGKHDEDKGAEEHEHTAVGGEEDSATKK